MTGEVKAQISAAGRDAAAKTGVAGVRAIGDVIEKAGFGTISAAAETVNAAAKTGANVGNVAQGISGTLGNTAINRSEKQATKAAATEAARAGKVAAAQANAEKDAAKSQRQLIKAQARARQYQQKSTGDQSRRSDNDVINSRITLFIDGNNRGKFATKKKRRGSGSGQNKRGI